jgi:hypothetical protein
MLSLRCGLAVGGQPRHQRVVGDRSALRVGIGVHPTVLRGWCVVGGFEGRFDRSANQSRCSGRLGRRRVGADQRQARAGERRCQQLLLRCGQAGRQRTDEQTAQVTVHVLLQRCSHITKHTKPLAVGESESDRCFDANNTPTQSSQTPHKNTRACTCGQQSHKVILLFVAQQNHFRVTEHTRVFAEQLLRSRA